MEFLKVNVIALMLMGMTSFNGQVESINVMNLPIMGEQSMLIVQGEGIIEDNDLILISANDPITQVEFIKVGKGDKITESGCNLLNCTIDVSNYQAGNYQVIVTTTTGGFTGTVNITHN